MKALLFVDKPTGFPNTQVEGGALKPLTQVLLDRRATQHFRPDSIPEEYLEAILSFAAQAPSGYNLQPWRFIVVRDPENRLRLQKAAFNQQKISEAPVVIVTFGRFDESRREMDEIFEEGRRRMGTSAEEVEKKKQNAAKFLDSVDPRVWVSRHTMIAVTTMMLIAEAYGLDTAPMEGFDPKAVKETLAIPEDAQVVALLAIGFSQDPDKLYGGRLALEEIVYEEHYGEKWAAGNGNGNSAREDENKRELEPVEAVSSTTGFDPSGYAPNSPKHNPQLSNKE